MSPTRKELTLWLATKEVKGYTLDIGGDVWSMKERVKSFEGEYETLNESIWDLNKEHWIDEIGGYDNIFCTEVLQFVYDPVMALRNIHQWSDLGKVFLSFHLTHPPMKSHDYLRYTEKGIRKLLEVTEFTIDEFLEPLPGYFLVQCSA